MISSKLAMFFMNHHLFLHKAPKLPHKHSQPCIRTQKDTRIILKQISLYRGCLSPVQSCFPFLCFSRTLYFCTLATIDIIRYTAEQVVTLIAAALYDISVFIKMFSVAFAVFSIVSGSKLYTCYINNHIIT